MGKREGCIGMENEGEGREVHGNGKLGRGKRKGCMGMENE